MSSYTVAKCRVFQVTAVPPILLSAAFDIDSLLPNSIWNKHCTAKIILWILDHSNVLVIKYIISVFRCVIF